MRDVEQRKIQDARKNHKEVLAMKQVMKRRIWVGFISTLLILSLILSFAGCAGEEEGDVATVTGINPTSGEIGETLAVTITGTNFTDASAVSFGAGITVSFTVDSATKITANIAIAATATEGLRDVSVTTPIGTGALEGGFTVKGLAPPPTVTGISPGSAKVGQRLDVSITGTKFANASAVSLGSGITVNSFTVDSVTKITADISIDAAASTGTRDVSVTIPDGTGTMAGGFTVSSLQAPTVTGVSPASGVWGETLDVTITGTNFSDVGFVSFGPQIDVTYTVDSATQITAELTISDELTTTGSRDVTVGNPDGPGTLAGGFTVVGTPIEIGALWSYTGVIGATGPEAENGINLFLDEVDHQVAGRPIDVIYEDVASDPATGVDKARKLVESDNVDLLMGLVHSGIAIAVRQYVDAQQVPLVITGFAGAQVLSFELKSDYILRTSPINGINSVAIANYAYDDLGYRSFVVMAEDYAAGHEFANVFKGIIKEKGGEIVQEIYTPYGAVDYSAYLSQLEDADAVWGFYNVIDALNFVQQYREFGIWDRMPLIGVSGIVTVAIVEAQGEDADGILMGGVGPPYGAWPDNPDYIEFQERYFAEYGEEGGDIAVNAYTGMKVIYQALEAVEGNIEDALAFLAAAKEVEFEGLSSPISFDAERNSSMMAPRVFRIEIQEGEPPSFTVLKTYEQLGPGDLLPYRAG
jgi:branched-chain amino acid transport system substrate-binding protein